MPARQDRQKFADIADANYGRIFRGALSLTGDRHAAEEIVQETFLVAFRKFGRFTGKSSAFSWLYGIMLNKYREHFRKIRLVKRLGFVRANVNSGETGNVRPINSPAGVELANSEESELLMKAVDRLPFKLRAVVAMHYFDDLSLRDIAEILNCRPGTVKSRLFNARKRLYQSLRGKVKDGCQDAVPKS